MLLLSTIQAQPYFEYLGYGASVLAMYFILRKAFKKDIKKVEGMISSKVDTTDYNSFKADHQRQHEQEQDDIKYVRGKIDEIYKYLLENK